MVFNETDPDVVDSNGEKYLVGWDDYGWFTVMRVDLFVPDDPSQVASDGTVEYKDEEHHWEAAGDHPAYSFKQEDAETLSALIEAGQ